MPVGGGDGGIGEALGIGVGVALGDALGDGEGVADGAGVALGEGLGEALGAGVGLGDALGAGVALGLGEVLGLGEAAAPLSEKVVLARTAGVAALLNTSTRYAPFGRWSDRLKPLRITPSASDSRSLLLKLIVVFRSSVCTRRE